ncbi:MAG: signal peptidase I [Clostridia bacterium]|nr:signal peptidase I [Clostridia bacterium]
MRRVEEYWYKFEYETSECSGSASKAWLGAYNFVDSIKLAAVVLMLIVTFVGKPFTVQGDSMLPTLRDGERLAALSINSEFKRGDIVVVLRHGAEHSLIVKRVIAVGGDSVDIDFSTGDVFVNGEMLDEPYINDKTYLSFDVTFPLEVPEGSVFVLGDNRNNSLDSRSSEIGLVDERNILGKTFIRFSPFGLIN